MRLNPYLKFDGCYKAAFEFYEKCLDAKIVVIMTYGESPLAVQARRTGGMTKSCTLPLLGAITYCKVPTAFRETTVSRRASPCCSTSTPPRKRIAFSTPSHKKEQYKFPYKSRSGPHVSAPSLTDSVRRGRSTPENRIDRPSSVVTSFDTGGACQRACTN